MIANLVRTVSFIPGGLGTFEAAAVLMLKMGWRFGICPQHFCFEGLPFSYPWFPDFDFSPRQQASQLCRWKVVVRSIGTV
jgi:hypothetical protein